MTQKVSRQEAEATLTSIVNGFKIYGATGTFAFQGFSGVSQEYKRPGRSVSVLLRVEFHVDHFEVTTCVPSTHRTTVETAALLSLLQDVQALAATLQAAADSMVIVKD